MYFDEGCWDNCVQNSVYPFDPELTSYAKSDVNRKPKT